MATACEVEIEGKTYRGTYTVTPGKLPVIEVTCIDPWGTETTQLGRLSAEDLAPMLLGEIVTRGLAKKKSQLP